MPWINWKPARALVIHPPQSGNLLSTLTDPKKTLTKEQAEATFKVPDSIQIMPGLGFYNDVAWNAVKNDPILKIHIANGDLMVVTKGLVGIPGPDTEKPVDKLPDSLEKVSVNGAEGLAEGCMDTAILQKWLDAESKGTKRDRVVKALEAQLKKIEETEKRFKGE